MARLSLQLDADVVDVWVVNLELNAVERAGLRLHLCREELERASHLLDAQVRDRFVAARGWLRAVLAGYLAISPGVVQFGYTRHGKPYLLQGKKRHWLRFNLSTSGNLGLIGVANGREIGVDLQEMLPDIDYLTIARQFFSAAELQTLTRLPSEMQLEAFYLGWTRKEAFVKASGEGFARSLANFDVSLTPGQAAALLKTHPDPAEAKRWRLVDVEVGTRYKAALAIEGGNFEVRRRFV